MVDEINEEVLFAEFATVEFLHIACRVPARSTIGFVSAVAWSEVQIAFCGSELGIGEHHAFL